MTDWILAELPVPRELPLPLPLNEVTLKSLLVPLFLLHIVFVNLMVGGSILTACYELIGLKRPRYDRLAQHIAATVTVNQSLAVLLGLGPLLAITLVYAVQFTSANASTGHAWVLIIPLTTLAFLATYLHLFTWNRWNTGVAKGVHVILGMSATLLFLVIPWIFLVNVHLMQYPEHWYDIHGFWALLRIDSYSICFRYFQFVAACLCVTALFLCVWMTRSHRAIAALPTEFTKSSVRRHFYKLAFYTSLTQFIVGPIILAVMPATGRDATVVAIFMVCGFLSACLVCALWLETIASDEKIGRLWVPIFFVFQLLAYSMGAGRQMSREVALADDIEKIKIHTDEYEAKVYVAGMRRKAGLSAEADGQELFRTICAACHLPDKVVAAPSAQEIIKLYAGKPDDIVAWATKPARKRPQFSPMPAMASLGEKKLRMIAEFMATHDPNDVAALGQPIPKDAMQFLSLSDQVAEVLSRQGDVNSGKDLFVSKACISCHVFGQVEMRRAPDLTGIRHQQNREVLLESILNPSKQFAKGYQPIMILTTEGQAINGLLVSENDDELVFRQADGQVITMSTDDIEASKPTTQSPMPVGLVDALTPQQVADLLAYLQSL